MCVFVEKEDVVRIIKPGIISLSFGPEYSVATALPVTVDAFVVSPPFDHLWVVRRAAIVKDANILMPPQRLFFRIQEISR